MKTLNGYIQVKPLENNTKGIMVQGETPIVEVISSYKGSELKKGDKVIYKGQKLEIKTEVETLYFINEDDIIAVIC